MVRQRAPVAIPIAAAVAAIASALASTGSSRLAWCGVVAASAVAWAAVRAPKDGTLLVGQVVPIAVGTAVLACSRVGLDPTGATESWRSVLAIGAYPFLGHALVRMVAAHHRIRENDVLVEAALAGTAAGIVLHVAVSGWRAQAFTSAWGDAQGAFPAMLVGLDILLLVIGVRGLRSTSARRSPLALMNAGLVCLLVVHLWQEVAVTHGPTLGPIAEIAALGALLCFGTASVHPSANVEPDCVLEQPLLFSSEHAGVVVVALLAAPAVLAVQAIRGVTASATMSTGAVLSGGILACYLVGLLRERATTEHQATHDGLTGLPNRTLLVDRLERSIAHARRNSVTCAVLFIDLDRFKEINDTFGHASGDDLLRAVAGRLQRCVRDEDTVARLAGDEFVLLLPHLASPEDVLIVAERVLEAIGQPITVVQERILLAGSVGVAVYPNDGATAEDLLASADAAMYRAKETAGNCWEVFSSELGTQAQARLRVEAELLDALDRHELVLHYQPIVDLASGRTVGAEALVRWNHPERGLVPPGEFVPIAEQSDLIVMIGDHVVHQACRELRYWQDLGLGDLTVSVNVASRQFTTELVSSVTAALRATGADPHNLILELTESTIIENVEAVAATLEEFHTLGIRAAIDDFGTGYCGLRYLSTLPVSALKIDRSFIHDMTSSGAAIAAATIALGHSLGLTVVAEGVETPEQQRFLTDQGCDRAQGFLLGRPVAAEDIIERLRMEQGVTSLLMLPDPPPTPGTTAAHHSVAVAAGA